MFENPRRGRQARNFTTNVPKILDLKRTDIFRKLTLGAPVLIRFRLKVFVSVLLGISGKTQPSTFLLGTSITVSALQVFSLNENMKS